MAAGGLPSVENLISEDLKERNYTARVIDLARDMMEYVANFKIKCVDKIQLKIGIHHGKCIMGIIGYHKPQFSLIGDTVNVTSRHCTTGNPGSIMVSKEAWERADIWDLDYKLVTTDMKGKGRVDVYHIWGITKSFKSRLISGIENLPKLRLQGLTEFTNHEIESLQNLKDWLEENRMISYKDRQSAHQNRIQEPLLNSKCKGLVEICRSVDKNISHNK